MDTIGEFTLVGRLQARLNERAAECERRNQALLGPFPGEQALASAENEAQRAFDRFERTRKALVRARSGKPYWRVAADWLDIRRVARDWIHAARELGGNPAVMFRDGQRFLYLPEFSPALASPSAALRGEIADVLMCEGAGRP